MAIVKTERVYDQWRRTLRITDFGLPASGQLVENVGGSVTYNGLRTCQDVPGFRQKIRRGVTATGPYSADRYRVEVDYPGFGRHGLVYLAWVQGPNPDPGRYVERFRTESWDNHLVAKPISLNHLPTSGSQAANRALTRILEKIRSEDSQASGLISLGEFRETVAMLRSPYKGARDLISKHLSRCEKVYDRSLRGRKLREYPRNQVGRIRREITDAVAQSWLETMFGLLPLISDVEDIAKAVTTFFDDEPKTALRSRSWDTFEDSGSLGTNSLAQLETFGTYKRVTEHRVQYSVGMRPPRAALGSAERLTDLLGFRASEFVPAIWELIPWSFLVDYFVGIGNLLEAVSTDTSRVSWISRTESTKTIYTLTGQVRQRLSAGYQSRYFFSRPQQFVLSRTTVSRTNPSSLGWPDLQYKNPFGDFAKSGNILALFQQRLDGIAKKYR